MPDKAPRREAPPSGSEGFQVIDWIIAVLASYLQSAWEWITGVAPYVGAFALVGLGGIFFAAIVIGAKQKQDARVQAILENAQKLNAKPQGQPKVWSL